MKRFLMSVMVLACALVVSACAYLYRPLGQLPEGERLETVQASKHYRDGAFQNEVASPPRSGDFSFIWAVFKGRFEPRDRPTPPAPLPSVKTDLAALPRDRDTVIWLGHSSYFVQLGGKRLLIDPVFSSYAAPLPWMVRAFDGTSPYAVQPEQTLPAADAAYR
jgi:hypothetical protein